MQSALPYPPVAQSRLAQSRQGRSLAVRAGRRFAGAQAAMGAIPPTGLVLLSVLSIQISAVLAKTLFTLLDPMGATFLRVSLAAVMLTLLSRPRWRDHSRRDYLLIAALGASIACMNLTFYGSIARIPLGIAVAIEFIGPLGVAVLGSRRPIDLVWIALAAAGIALLAPFGGMDLDPVGVGLALIAGVCWGAYILLAGMTGRAFPGGTGLAMAMAIGAVLLLPIGGFSSGTALLNPMVWLIGIGVALMGSVIPYSLEYSALKRMSSRVFGVLMSIEPAVAALIGFLLLGEYLDWRSLTAIVLITLAAIGVTLFGGRTDR